VKLVKYKSVELVDILLQNSMYLTEWEVEFLKDVRRIILDRGMLSNRQHSKLMQMKSGG